MKKLNKKGVSLGETMAAITILGIVLGVALTTVNSRAKQLKMLNDEMTIKFKLNDSSNKYFLYENELNDKIDPSSLYGTHKIDTMDNLIKNTSQDIPQTVIDDLNDMVYNSKSKYLLSFISENERVYHIVREIEPASTPGGDGYIPPSGGGVSKPDTPFDDSINTENIPAGTVIEQHLLKSAKDDIINRLNVYFNPDLITDPDQIDTRQYFRLGKDGQIIIDNIVKRVTFIDIDLINIVKSKEDITNPNEREYKFYASLELNTNNEAETANEINYLKVYGNFNAIVEQSGTSQRPKVTITATSKDEEYDHSSFKPPLHVAKSTNEYYGYNTEIDVNLPKTDIVRLSITNALLDYLNGKTMTSKTTPEEFN